MRPSTSPIVAWTFSSATGSTPPGPSVVFVGRITRQKGLTHLLDAAPAIDPEAQLVLCAGAPDTPEIAREIGEKMESVRSARGNVIWIEEMLAKPDVIQILSHATVFACPSVYEPMGIVNLEAMACEAAVVATAVGGIPEVVEDGVTGLLVPYEAEPDGTGTPARPGRAGRGSCGARQRAPRRPGPRRGDGPRGPGAGGRALRLGRRGGGDAGVVRAAAREVIGSSRSSGLR